MGAWLEQRGWIVLGTNVRVGRDEIDVVALEGRVLVLVEVRYRRAAADGHPLETVTRAKAARLRRAALKYAARKQYGDIRIDVAAVLGDTIEMIENAVDFTST